MHVKYALINSALLSSDKLKIKGLFEKREIENIPLASSHWENTEHKELFDQQLSLALQRFEKPKTIWRLLQELSQLLF